MFNRKIKTKLDATIKSLPTQHRAKMARICNIVLKEYNECEARWKEANQSDTCNYALAKSRAQTIRFLEQHIQEKEKDVQCYRYLLKRDMSK